MIMEETGEQGPRRKRLRGDPTSATTAENPITEGGVVQQLDPELYSNMRSENTEALAKKKAERQIRKKEQARTIYYKKVEEYRSLVEQEVCDKRVARAWRIAATARKVGVGIPGQGQEMVTILEKEEAGAAPATPRAAASTKTAATTRAPEATTAATTTVALKIRRWESRLATTTTATTK